MIPFKRIWPFDAICFSPNTPFTANIAARKKWNDLDKNWTEIMMILFTSQQVCNL